MNENEQDFDELAALWRQPRERTDDAISDGPLRRMIAAHRRRLAAVVIGEAALLGGLAALTWTKLADGIVVAEVVWAVTLWVFMAIAASFAWWNRRGMWHAMGLSVADFRRRRAERQLRAARFAWMLFIAEVMVVAAELAWFERFTTTAAVILLGSALPLGVWWLWIKRRAARELAYASEIDDAADRSAAL